jgi:FAD-dependent urate hydroxylase
MVRLCFPAFESSLRGVHFIGLAAAHSFGPMLRFTYGAALAANRLARDFGRTLSAIAEAAGG